MDKLQFDYREIAMSQKKYLKLSKGINKDERRGHYFYSVIEFNKSQKWTRKLCYKNHSFQLNGWNIKDIRRTKRRKSPFYLLSIILF
ncbi:hypothetical protein D3854_00510 [Streptococcus mutans]|jgi:hypothetical protein|uniref:hypothetical protein n=1 Tax=Streptococcus mutans TaxID=1309 RepID=UPI0002B5C7B7|nr:hypothetical protein [Streptococcus mutans]EMB52756.1 hypothetical protein SMU3_07236 [Streptococcus mutans 11A1]EMC11873.1 hypothetical protein SMU75_04534 [Streptococcus mutans N3209]AMF85670.1 hypothetical protein APQ13_04255 [Streptococcus mutans]ARS62169.1 hypothetical protein RO10_02700 [Streptococcus mutans]EMB60148.1 hypothetical protein SMU20_03708 [Streptococcus mutans 15JP3]